MTITEDKIARFFTGACTKKEKEQIARYFEENPSELETYMPEKGWNEDLTLNTPIDKHISDKILEKIRYATFGEKTHKRRKIAFLISAAAAVMIIVIGLWASFQKNAMMGYQPTVYKNGVANTKIFHFNSSAVMQHILLPDSSVVELFPHSSIAYFRYFEPQQRNIQLQGEAIFQVYKDASKPFTVFSSKVATTALGTRFRVKISNEKISVTLYEGKILVRKSDEAEENTFVQNKTDRHPQHFYLTAGNAIAYNIIEDKFIQQKSYNIPLPKSLIKPSPVKVQLAHSTKIIFNNLSLSKAFDKLANKYNVEILYAPQDVENINIIANISTTQDIQLILKNIAIMNNLTLTRVNAHKFEISKKGKER